MQQRIFDALCRLGVFKPRLYGFHDSQKWT